MFMLRPRLVVKRNLSSGRGNFRLATNQKLANSATVRYPTSTSVHAKGCIVSLRITAGLAVSGGIRSSLIS